VEQCAVIGKPDMNVGEAPVAFVQLKKGAEATAEEVMEHTNSQVAAYKKIREVKFLDAIPVSAAGKVLKRELRDMLESE
jgi:long-chain acyl-CoA synthetase